MSTGLLKILSNDNRSDHDQPLLQIVVRLLACGELLRRVVDITHCINRLILDYPSLSQQFILYEQKTKVVCILTVFEKTLLLIVS